MPDELGCGFAVFDEYSLFQIDADIQGPKLNNKPFAVPSRKVNLMIPRYSLIKQV